MDFKPYVDLFAALLTPMIGVTTAWIAVQQYRLAKERMRRDFYDRRIAVYRGVLEVLSSILTFGEVRRDAFATWARATAEKDFLFEPDLCDYLETVRKQAVAAWAIGVQVREGLPAEKRAELVARQTEILVWLSEQIQEVQNRFAKYLRIA